MSNLLGNDTGGGGSDRSGGGLGLVGELSGERSENLVVDGDGSLMVMNLSVRHSRQEGK